MVRHRTTAAAERVLGYIGLFALGVVAVAAERLDRDALPGRSSLAGRLARAAIAGVAAAGWIADRIAAARDGRGHFVAQREGGGK